MDMYKLKLTTLQNEIFRLLCIRANMPLNQRGVAKLLKVSPTAIAKATPLLEEKGLIKTAKHETMNLISIELNRDNPTTIALKRAENLKMIYESGLAGYLEERFPGSTIILFGSYSRGEDTASSDIDIAIIGSEKETKLIEYERLLERAIRLNFYKCLGKIGKNLQQNIISGITLSGTIEL